MTLDLATVLEAVKSWPVEDRLALRAHLFDESDGPAMTLELERRLADVEANPDDVCTWDEVLAYVKRPKP